MERYCVSCGHLLGDGFFCANCGAPVTSQPAAKHPGFAAQPHAEGSTASVENDGALPYANQVKPGMTGSRKVSAIVGALIAIYFVYNFASSSLPFASTTQSNAGSKIISSHTSTSFSNGVWLAGTDINSGTYRPTSPASGNCYWEIATGTTMSDIVANDAGVSGFPILTLSDGQYVKTDGCPDFSQQDMGAIAAQGLATVFGSGSWTVGVDIEPGLYRTSTEVSGSDCYWQVSTLGTNETDIVANDNVSGGIPSIQVAEGQSVKSSSCGTFAKVG